MILYSLELQFEIVLIVRSQLNLEYNCSLTRVRSLVGLQMGTFRVDLFASGKLTLVYPAFRVLGTVFVTPCVMPARHRRRHRRRGTRVTVLRAGYRWKTVRRYRDQSKHFIDE